MKAALTEAEVAATTPPGQVVPIATANRGPDEATRKGLLERYEKFVTWCEKVSHGSSQFKDLNFRLLAAISYMCLNGGAIVLMLFLGIAFCAFMAHHYSSPWVELVSLVRNLWSAQ